MDILWNDKPRMPKSHGHPYGELYLRVSMSRDSNKTRFWNLLVNDCLPIMGMIDWARSHPDNIHDFCLAYGIDAGWTFFLDVCNLFETPRYCFPCIHLNVHGNCYID